jgi:hypothetical protein
VHGQYFPLDECGLTLDKISYFNLVRCRTRENSSPNKAMSSTCADIYLARWLDFLKRRAVVFIGKWAATRARSYLEGSGIPHAFIDRNRSLNSAQRQRNRSDIVALMRSDDHPFESASGGAKPVRGPDPVGSKVSVKPEARTADQKNGSNADSARSHVTPVVPASIPHSPSKGDLMANQEITPQRVIRVLAYLEQQGFSDELFSRLHHKGRETIRNMKNYCESIGAFQSDSPNVSVCERLVLVAGYCEARSKVRATAITRPLFQRFVDAALIDVPL